MFFKERHKEYVIFQFFFNGEEISFMQKIDKCTQSFQFSNKMHVLSPAFFSIFNVLFFFTSPLWRNIERTFS